VSKAHDDPSRASKDPAPGGAKPGGEVTKVADGATPRRVRSAGPRERSGPIGISSGDFSTPVVRKRTTTQPRGVPVLGARVPAPSLDEPVTASADAAPVDFEDQVTPAPEPVPPAMEVAPEPAATFEAPPEPEPFPAMEPTPAPEPMREPEPSGSSVVGAMPAAAVEAIPVAMPTRPPPPPLSGDDDPFGGGGPARLDIDAEAAALAAEAAAVRALDSGPLTPLPEVVSPPKTPPTEIVPETRTPAPEVRAATPTPPPDIVVTRTPPPELAAAPKTPLPDVASTRTPAPEVAALRMQAPDITVIRTPPPELVDATRTPAPEIASVRTPPPVPAEPDYSSPIAAAAAAAAEAEQVTPPPELNPEPAVPPVAAGLPSLEMQANAGLASLPAVALSDAEGGDAALAAVGDGEVDGDEHVEVMDPTEEAEDADGNAATQAKALRTPTLKNAAPPPIPGSHLRTPGPELIVPAAVGVVAPSLPPILPEALAQRPRRPKRSKPWFEEVFDEDYLRTLPFMRADQTLREVEFISDALRLGPGAEILDIACGYGRHAIELVQRGYNVTGLDLSLPLLIRAADEAQRRALSVNFVHADMREMAFEKQFDGAYSMLTSFGYFDEDTNLRVAERIGRALKPGARFLLDVVNRDYVVSDLPVRVWWEGTGCVVLEEVDFNFHTSRIVTHRSIVFEDGRQLEQEISVRAYSLHEIGRLLRQAGFRVMDVSGGLNTRGQFFGSVSRSLLIVAEKRESDSAQPL
jgi:SAM-dependent methyltransferase